MLGTSADKHWREIQLLKVAQAKHDAAHDGYAQQLEELKAVHEACDGGRMPRNVEKRHGYSAH